MLIEPKWVGVEQAITLHDTSIGLHGGKLGIRDLGLIESAMARPENLFAYNGITDVPTLAANYAAAIAKNHGFIDGNKRAALHVSALFAVINGYWVSASQNEMYAHLEMFADAEVVHMDDEALLVWYQNALSPMD